MATTATTTPSAEPALERQQSSRLRWTSLALIAVAVVPIVAGKFGLISNYTFLQLSLMIVYAIAVLGLNLLTGWNGQISLGHGAFFAVGAYSAAILIDAANWPYWATLPAAAFGCFCIGYLFGLPALRLEGHYLALATFALAIAVPQILKYRHLEGLTGGVEGINLVKKHTKPNPLKGTTGGIVEKAMPIHQSNVAIFNAATGKADRVGIKVVDGKRVRVFKSSGEEIKAA